MMNLLKVLKVRIILQEEALGMSPDPKTFLALFKDIAKEHGVSDEALAEELAAIAERDGDEAAIEEIELKGKTLWPRDEDGCPIIWDYQMKGWAKDACGMLYRVAGSQSSGLKAYKKTIDGLIFPHPRKIRLNMPEGTEIGNCCRPLRANTSRGEITALANSETVPAGTTLDVEFRYLDSKDRKPKVEGAGKAKTAEEKSLIRSLIIEWLDYGQLRGLGQWRNSGKGIFTYEILEG